jgi:cytochrome c oxidase subunit 4
VKVQTRTNAKTQATTTGHDHPTASTFVKVGGILAVLTAIEFLILYVTGKQAFVITVLAVLSIVKFVLVVGYFMHLKFDHKLLGWSFAVGALLATAITVAQIFVNRA